MADRPRRLTLLAHAPTAAASGLVLGGDGPLLRAGRTGPGEGSDGDLPPAPCGPEVACVQTARALDRHPLPVPDLREPDLGRWRGRSLAEVAEADPDGLQQWLTDPAARPHGGETLAELVARVDGVLARSAPSVARELWVATPLVVRALTVAALRAPAALVLALDVAFGGRVLLSGNGPRWRLQGLERTADLSREDPVG